MNLTGFGTSISLDPKFQRGEPLRTVEGQPLKFYVDGFYHTFTPNNRGDKQIKIRLPRSWNLNFVKDEQWSGREIYTEFHFTMKQI